ncbi:hypothetical protein P7K49_039660, partial [Saguinus oedipus]
AIPSWHGQQPRAQGHLRSEGLRLALRSEGLRLALRSRARGRLRLRCVPEASQCYGEE